MKRPSFQFYPADWRNDSKLRRCTVAARGAWMEVLCVLHDGDEYGVCRWTLVDLARAAGVPVRLLQELSAKGVLKGDDREVGAFVYTPRHAGQDGEPVTLIPTGAGPCWFSSRMVRDEYVRQHRGAGTRFVAEAQPPKPAPKPTPKPPIGDGLGDGASSSSSSSSSRNTPKPPRGGDEADPQFARFWAAYPRKVAKDAALKAFAKRKPDEVLVGQMIAAIERQGLAEKCQRGEGQYVPYPATWLNEGRWKDDLADPQPGGAKPAWALKAGFTNRFDAENAGCNERNAGQFREGKRLEIA
jgi:hypothetical protein